MGISMENILYTIDLLPSDITKSIHNELDFVSQCNFRLVSIYFTQRGIIPERVNCSGNKKITDVNHLVNLKILHSKNKCGIDNEGIRLLTNLTRLDNSNNSKISIGTR